MGKKKKTKMTSHSNYSMEKKKKKIIASSVVSVEILHTLKQQHISALSLLEYVKLEYGRNMGRSGHDIDSENKERMDLNMDTTNPLQRPFQLQEKPSQERIDEYYRTPELVNSIRDNDLVKVRALYTAGKITCNACNPLFFVKDKRGFTPLDYSRKEEHIT